jgi:hypothetical protein
VLQLAGVSVVETVDSGPVSVGNGTEERTNKADSIVYTALLQERVMATIMLDDENTTLKYMAIQSATKGPKLLNSCPIARPVFAF